MSEKTVHIPNISCGHCVMAVKNEAGEIPGVTKVDGDPNTKNVTSPGRARNLGTDRRRHQGTPAIRPKTNTWQRSTWLIRLLRYLWWA